MLVNVFFFLIFCQRSIAVISSTLATQHDFSKSPLTPAKDFVYPENEKYLAPQVFRKLEEV